MRPQEHQKSNEKEKESAIIPEIPESEKGINSQEELDAFKEETIRDVQESSAGVIASGSQTIESAIKSIDGTSEDINEGKEAVAEVSGEITELALTTKKNIEGVSTEEKRSALKNEYTAEQLAELRTKTKEDYGEGLVSKYHKGAKTREEHESAQREAYIALDEKIENGVVKPDSIQSDITEHLKLGEQKEITIENVDEINDLILKELQEFSDNPEIAVNESEVVLIGKEASRFAEIYQQAFPEIDPQQVYQLTRDNARKLVYQTSLDKRVFSGSDHGTRHILEGNMKWADKIIDSLGERISPKDKVLIHQIIIDHDLGYTTSIAQAEKSFAASKDHPLFSAKFIEANKEYYTEKFGEDGYEMIRDGILQHSYVTSEYTSEEQMKDINPDIVRSITSTVDALGVTAETKCPAFFREPDVIIILQKVKLFAETHGGEVSDEALNMYKDQLREIASRETNQDRKRAYLSAIENQFNPVTVEMTLGQFTGVMTDIQMVEREGKLVPHIKMEISQMQALLGDLFGDKISTKAFAKAMEDFGVDEGVVDGMAKIIRKAREAKGEDEKNNLLAELKYESDKGIFEFGTDFGENTSEIAGNMREFMDQIAIRDEIRTLVRRLESPEERSSQNIEEALEEFYFDISEETDEDDLIAIRDVANKLRYSADNPEEFDKALAEFNTITTKKEREFMGI